jgi:hypothetical protein
VDEVAHCNSRHVRVTGVGETVVIRITPHPLQFLYGFVSELSLAALFVYGASVGWNKPGITPSMRVGMGILSLMIFPMLFLCYPGWRWVCSEVLTLTPRTLEVRLEWWRFGHTNAFDLDKLHNFRVKPVNLAGLPANGLV